MKKIGLKDIAEHVGVSVALVSYVLNGQAEKKQVSKENAAKIRAAAELLNYRPNHIAKSLKMDKTHTIGLVVADIKYRFSTGITRAIEAEARKNNYTVLLGSSNEDTEMFGELVGALVNRQVDGLILVATENSEPQLRMLQKSGIPFILIDRTFPDMDLNSITLDNYKAAYDSTAYLLKLGHQRIAFFNYTSSLFHLKERTRGYLQSLKDHKITFEPEWMQSVRSGQTADVSKALARLLTGPDPCDAVFFATDTLALAGLKYLNQTGVRVPEQVSVFSFDESEAFDLFYCKVTHSRQPLEEMGRRAVSRLLQLIAENETPLEMGSLEAELVTGTSCRE